MFKSTLQIRKQNKGWLQNLGYYNNVYNIAMCNADSSLLLNSHYSRNPTSWTVQTFRALSPREITVTGKHRPRVRMLRQGLSAVRAGVTIPQKSNLRT